MFLSEWREFPSAPCPTGGKKKNLMTARFSMLLKSRASMTCFRACFLPGRAKDLSAPGILYMQLYMLCFPCVYASSLAGWRMCSIQYRSNSQIHCKISWENAKTHCHVSVLPGATIRPNFVLIDLGLCRGFWWRNLRERDLLKDPGVDVRII